MTLLLPDGFALHQHWSLLEVGVHKVFTCNIRLCNESSTNRCNVHDPGILPGSADWCIHGNVYLRSDLPSK